MTKNTLHEFPENLQEVSPADIAVEIKRLSSLWLEAVQKVQRDPQPLVDDVPQEVEAPRIGDFAEWRKTLDRKPEYQLINIGSDLENAAALLHVAYRAVAFNSEDYEDGIFSLSIGNGGDQVLIQKILDLVTQCYEKVNNLRSQLEAGEE